MAQQTPQYPPRAFSPHQAGAASPQSPYPNGPQIKRQRLSPNGQSPYNSPNMANLSLPSQIFSAPYHGNQTNGTSASQHYSSMNHGYTNTATPARTANPTYKPLPTPNPVASQQPVSQTPSATATANVASSLPNAMGPPGRPDNRPTDLNELGDVLFGAGVDLREEEAALLRSRESSTQKQHPNMNFVDQLREASGGDPNAKYPFSRENFYTNNVPGDRASFYGGGTFNQPGQPEQSADEIAKAKREHEARMVAEIKQYHLNRPFLQAGNLHKRLSENADNLHVQIPVKDTEILKPTQPIMKPQEIKVVGPDENPVMKVVKGEPLLLLKNSLVDILSLISLASEERVRNIVEDAAVLARGRRTGSTGLVPQDLVDLAEKDVNGEAAATLPTPSNSATSPNDNPLKRSYSEMNSPPPPLTPVSNPSQPPSKPTPNTTALTLQRLDRADRLIEDARLAKRRKRLESASRSNGADSLSLDPANDVAPAALIADLPKKSALKNQKKIPTSDTQAFANANKTVNMAMAGIGKKLSWMTGGKAEGPSNPFKANNAANVKKEGGGGGGDAKGRGGAGAGGGTSASSKTGGAAAKKERAERRYGEFREQGPQGSGIQLRDLIGVLERERKDERVVQVAYGLLNKR